MLSLSIFLVLLLEGSFAFNFFSRIDITNKTGAACLDGSSPAFYLWLPDGLDNAPNKLLIHFEETPFGWCVKQDLSTSLEECLKFII
jgi:hypothetical protein